MTEANKDNLTFADIRNKFKLYSTEDGDLFTGPHAIRYIGTAADFLSIASSLGVLIIYTDDRTSRSDQDDNLPARFGFLKDGFMHVFDSIAESKDTEEQVGIKPPSGNMDALSRIKQNPDE
jgi:hypothetical protein